MCVCVAHMNVRITEVKEDGARAGIEKHTHLSPTLRDFFLIWAVYFGRKMCDTHRSGVAPKAI